MPPTCWRWPPSTRRSRSCWRRRVNACKTCSICPALREVLGQLRSRTVRVVNVDTRQGVAVRPEPAVQLDRRVHVRRRRAAGRAPRRGACRWIAICCAICSAPKSCASCSIRRCSPMSSSNCSASPTAGGRAAPTSCTMCFARSAISPSPRSICAARVATGEWIDELARTRRAIEMQLGGEPRLIAAEDAARYRDAFGCNVPLGLPLAFTEPVAHPLESLVARYARTHGPFTPADVAARFASPTERIVGALAALEAADRVVHGEFRPGGVGREYCDADVLRQLRRRSLAMLRREVEPVEPEALRPVHPGMARHSRRAPRPRFPGRGAWPNCKVQRWRRPRWRASCFRRGCEPTGRPISTSCARQAMSSGSVVVGSGPATAGSGCTSPTSSRCSMPRSRPPSRQPVHCTTHSAPTCRPTEPASGTSCALRLRMQPMANCSPRCGIWSGRARSPTTRWLLCGRCCRAAKHPARRLHLVGARDQVG